MSFDQGNAGSSGGVDSTGDSDGEDQEDSSSTSSNLNADTHYVLENFRQQWQRELNITPKHKKIGQPKESVDKLVEKYDDVETKAKILFLNGVENEQKGKLYEAIQFYRRAVQLVPDIEFKLYDSTKNVNRGSHAINEPVESNDADFSTTSKEDYDSEDDDLDDLDLYTKFQRKISKKHIVCSPNYEQKHAHISSLPIEIILYILRWVVSSDLDLRSLESCSLVCRGFYICCRDSEIWRLACARVWGMNCGNSPDPYLNWREMFIDRPRLKYNGCYISKTTYFRHGENSFQDQYYRPWQLVEYYRYLRFFPEGKVLMLTTPEDPGQCVSQLKHRNPKHVGVLAGHYRLWNNSVSLLVQRLDRKIIQKFRGRRNKEVVDDFGDQTFHLEFQIQNHRRHKNMYLSWSGYKVFTRHSNGTESSNTFEIVGNKFPPLWFSRVKSYTAEAESVLQ